MVPFLRVPVLLELPVLSSPLIVSLMWDMKKEVMELTRPRLRLPVVVRVTFLTQVLTIRLQCLSEKTRAMPMETFPVRAVATVGRFLRAVGTPTTVPGWPIPL